MKFDLHTHTYYSGCSNLKPMNLLKAAKKSGLDGIAVVDHNSMKGSLKVTELNKDNNFHIIPGMEIGTKAGHLLALDINEEIKARNIHEIYDEVKKQDGVLIIAHPFSFIPLHSFQLPIEEIKHHIDGIEVFNSRNGLFSNPISIKKATEFNLAMTGGSDAHFAFEVGNAYTEFEGDLKKAIKLKQTKAHGKIKYGPIGSILSGLLKVVK
ncbi:PHP domain-containing protein [Nanoarchaeota archaeon]